MRRVWLIRAAVVGVLADGAQPPAEGNASRSASMSWSAPMRGSRTRRPAAVRRTLKRRLRSDIAAGRGIDRDGIAPGVRIPLPLSDTLLDNADS